MVEASISITTADGTTTGDVPMSVVRAALDRLKSGDFTPEQVDAMRAKKPDPASPRLPNTDPTDAYNITADELRQFIERFEQLEAEKKDAAEQQKELMAEAKGRGYDTKIIRKIVALRKRKPDDVAEEEAVLEMYKSALGMS